MPPAENIPASNTSSAPRVRPGAANSKARPEAVQISGFASPGRVIQQRAADQRRRKSYPRSIRCSSNPHSSELFSVPEANITANPGRPDHVTRSRFGSEQLANALLSPNAIVRHSKKRSFPKSSPRHHDQDIRQYQDKHREDYYSQTERTAGTPVHRRQGTASESSTLSCIQAASPPSPISPRCEQHRNRTESPITERRCSELATIDPSCLHSHNAPLPHLSGRTHQTQQELSCPRLLNLAHQTADSRRGSSPRNSLQPGREFTAKVRFDEVSS